MARIVVARDCYRGKEATTVTLHRDVTSQVSTFEKRHYGIEFESNRIEFQSDPGTTTRLPDSVRRVASFPFYSTRLVFTFRWRRINPRKGIVLSQEVVFCRGGCARSVGRSVGAWLAAWSMGAASSLGAITGVDATRVSPWFASVARVECLQSAGLVRK